MASSASMTGTMRGRLALITLLAAVGAAGCASTSETLTANPLALGTWGGDSAGMIVSDTALHLHIACTFGDVSGRIPVDANGTFDVQGSYSLHVYPVAVEPAVPARFVGHVNGSTATVVVTVNDTVQHQTVTRGPVIVTLGTDPRLGPCPICRRPIVTQSWMHRQLLTRASALAAAALHFASR
jgi:hypothetical protein